MIFIFMASSTITSQAEAQPLLLRQSSCTVDIGFRDFSFRDMVDAVTIN